MWTDHSTMVSNQYDVCGQARCPSGARWRERALQLRWEWENFVVFVRACAFVICQHSSHVYEDIVSVHLLPVGVNVHEVIIYRGYQHPPPLCRSTAWPLDCLGFTALFSIGPFFVDIIYFSQPQGCGDKLLWVRYLKWSFSPLQILSSL